MSPWLHTVDLLYLHSAKNAPINWSKITNGQLFPSYMLGENIIKIRVCLRASYHPYILQHILQYFNVEITEKNCMHNNNVCVALSFAIGPVYFLLNV